MKKCPNGHYYSDHLDACPYCGAPSTTDTRGGSTFRADETMIPETEKSTILPDEEISLPGGESTVDFNAGDFDEGGDRTIIIDKPRDAMQQAPVTRPKRKLVGWLVSYTLDELGYDYRLYEGKNVIGKRPGLEVSVLQDPSVSGIHATILYRNNKFLLRDEFSTNGTYLNGKIVEQETPELQDGDIIKVGNTEFLFRTAIY